MRMIVIVTVVSQRLGPLEYQLFGYSGDEEEKNAFLIAITKLPTNEHKALVFNTRDTVPIVVPYYIDNEKELLKYITTKVLGKEFSGIKKVELLHG